MIPCKICNNFDFHVFRITCILLTEMNGINKLKFSPSIDINVLKNATLILPAISVGNIGQLAIDILLASMKAEKLTACHHPSLIPLVGSNPIDALQYD